MTIRRWWADVVRFWFGDDADDLRAYIADLEATMATLLADLEKAAAALVEATADIAKLEADMAFLRDAQAAENAMLMSAISDSITHVDKLQSERMEARRK